MFLAFYPLPNRTAKLYFTAYHLVHFPKKLAPSWKLLLKLAPKRFASSYSIYGLLSWETKLEYLLGESWGISFLSYGFIFYSSHFQDFKQKQPQENLLKQEILINYSDSVDTTFRSRSDKGSKPAP